MARAPRSENRKPAGDPPDAPFQDGAGDAAGLPPASPPLDRTPRNLREERQARVGILRNHNRAALPVPRKAQLTGRWLKMQSSRRPREAGAGPSEPSGSKEDGPRPSFSEIVERAALRQGLIAVGKDGIEAIDIAGLMASVAGIGRTVPLRKPFAPVLYDDPLEGGVPPPMPDAAVRAAGKPGGQTTAQSGEHSGEHLGQHSGQHSGQPARLAPAPATLSALPPAPHRALNGDPAAAEPDAPSKEPTPLRKTATPERGAVASSRMAPPGPSWRAEPEVRGGKEPLGDRNSDRLEEEFRHLERRAALEEASATLRAGGRLGSHRSRSPVGAARRMSLPPSGYRDVGWGIPENVDLESEPPPEPEVAGWRGLVARLLGYRR